MLPCGTSGSLPSSSRPHSAPGAGSAWPCAGACARRAVRERADGHREGAGVQSGVVAAHIESVQISIEFATRMAFGDVHSASSVAASAPMRIAKAAAQPPTARWQRMPAAQRRLKTSPKGALDRAVTGGKSPWLPPRQPCVSMKPSVLRWGALPLASSFWG